jgi:hypothetical protein
MLEAHGALIVTHSGEQRADIRVPAAARHEHNGAFASIRESLRG